MKIVVAGGAGFIGSHLCEYLLTKSHEVICLDNLLTGNKKKPKKRSQIQTIPLYKDRCDS